MAIKLKEPVKNYLKTIAPDAASPTKIGQALGFSYGEASSKVNSSLKSLVADGWAVRLEKPVQYAKKQPD